ncbi:MAG: hypothetical protein HOY44_08980 [Maritimibacter sp.]|uniref:hypothetical protein n=1 Tax=Maritimibacter sp. TaxID=2003363 RepID=UPI001D7A88DB|nr:hypothetical protein [Maritimibacter sp.]MBL6427644.1 hypothetical protein [Maritimibacter sp.]
MALRGTWQEAFLPFYDPARMNVVQDERLVMNNRPPAVIAAGLRAIVGPAQFLMVARDHVGLKPSQYDMSPFYERGPDRGDLRFTPWLQEMLDKADENMTSSQRYGDMVDFYEGFFVAENLEAAAFEELSSDQVLQEALSGAFGIDAAEFTRIAGISKKGDATSHGFKKITRGILGGRKAGSYLSPGQILFARAVLRELFPGKKTDVDMEYRTRIQTYFTGQRVADLAGREAISVVHGHD